MRFCPTVIHTARGLAVLDELPPFGANGRPRCSLALKHFDPNLAIALPLTPEEAGELGAAMVAWGIAARAVQAEAGEENPCRRPRFELADEEGGDDGR